MKKRSWVKITVWTLVLTVIVAVGFYGAYLYWMRNMVDYLPLAEETVNFTGMLKLNESGVILWRALEKGGDRGALVTALTAEYAVSPQQAETDVDAFLDKLLQIGCVEA